MTALADDPVLNVLDYPSNFEDDDRLRSAFLRALTVEQIIRPPAGAALMVEPVIPRTVIRYWHDREDLPDDVCACLRSWEPLYEEGFTFRTFDDESAADYISRRYGDRERRAFSRCRHPAMRSDYLRMCFVLAEGGFYVDADDVLVGDGWRGLFLDGRLKVQPMCYDVPSEAMVLTADIWRADLPTADRIFYVNNNPIVAPAGHPVLKRALTRATDRLLGDDERPEIQSTTGPGNFTAALVAHARELMLAGSPPDYELLRSWDRIGETRWFLFYRGDGRNWRNMGGN